jgi:hypothetical protein
MEGRYQRYYKKNKIIIHYFQVVIQQQINLIQKFEMLKGIKRI